MLNEGLRDVAQLDAVPKKAQTEETKQRLDMEVAKVKLIEATQTVYKTEHL